MSRKMLGNEGNKWGRGSVNRKVNLYISVKKNAFTTCHKNAYLKFETR